MKKILVFGGTGFIGQHVARQLKDKGFEVTLFDRFRKRIQDNSDYNIFYGDITDRQAVSEAIYGHDGAINLAGILGTSETVDNPFPSVATNVFGGLHFLQACREHNVKGVQITVGNHFMNNSYAITKTTVERFALMYNKEHGTKIAVVRGLNAYGEGQKHKPVRKIIPNFVTRALRGEAIEINGDGEQVMDMIYVRDLADILIRALTMEHGVYDRIFEAGTGVKTTVNEIAELVNELSGNKGGVIHKEMRAGEPDRSIVLGDPSTLKVLYPQGFKLTSLRDGLRQTIDWYRDNYAWQAD